jgi:hypothetical protein
LNKRTKKKIIIVIENQFHPIWYRIIFVIGTILMWIYIPELILIPGLLLILTFGLIIKGMFYNARIALTVKGLTFYNVYFIKTGFISWLQFDKVIPHKGALRFYYNENPVFQHSTPISDILLEGINPNYASITINLHRKLWAEL